MQASKQRQPTAHKKTKTQKRKRQTTARARERSVHQPRVRREPANNSKALAANSFFGFVK
jgi:hypothetical protein